MLILPISKPPASGSELAAALRGALDSVVSTPPSVEAEGDWPSLRTLSIDLSGGQIRPTPPPLSDGRAVAAFTVERFELKGTPVRFETARANLTANAREVRFALKASPAGRLSLGVTGAESGRFSLSIARAELEALIRTVAGQAAQAQGVSIEGVKLETSAEGPGALSFRARIIAHKLFMNAAITLAGHLSVDSSLTAHLGKLSCSGSGIIGSLACGFIQPYVDRLNNRSFPLAGFGLGGIGVTEVRLDPGEPLQVSATFGKTPAALGKAS